MVWNIPHIGNAGDRSRWPHRRRHRDWHLGEIHGKLVQNQRNNWEKPWKTYGKPMEKPWKTHGKVMQKFGGVLGRSEGLNLVYMRLFSAGDGRCLKLGALRSGNM